MSKDVEFRRAVDLALWWIDQRADYFTVQRAPEAKAGRGRPNTRYVTKRDLDRWPKKGGKPPVDSGQYREASDPFALFQLAHFLRQACPGLTATSNKESPSLSILDAIAKAHRSRGKGPNSHQGLANLLSRNGLKFTNVTKKE